MSNWIVYMQDSTSIPAAAETDYPTTTVAADAVRSNANGVALPTVNALFRDILVGLEVTAADPPTARAVVDGYMRSTVDPSGAAVANDYAESNVFLIPWKPILLVAGGAAISPTYQAIGGQSIQAPDANSFLFWQKWKIPSVFDRVRLRLPVFTGTTRTARGYFGIQVP